MGARVDGHSATQAKNVGIQIWKVEAGIPDDFGGNEAGRDATHLRTGRAAERGVTGDRC